MTDPLPISDPAAEASPTWVAPDACTLPTVEQPVRVSEFDSLFAEALTSTERVSPTRARFALTGSEDTAARAQDLATRETACCSFFAFTITPTSPVSAIMDVTVPDARADVLAALVDIAEAAIHQATAGGLDA
jgi:hypothetical protein